MWSLQRLRKVVLYLCMNCGLAISIGKYRKKNKENSTKHYGEKRERWRVEKIKKKYGKASAGSK